MTPARRARIKAVIDQAREARELSGIRWSLQQSGEWVAEIVDHFQEIAVRRGWWPVPEYGGPKT